MTEEMTGKAREVRDINASEHNPENLSYEPFELILVELKG
jgi:hypothetical protein